MNTIRWGAWAVALGAMFGTLYLGNVHAGNEKALHESVFKIGDQLKAGDKTGATKAAADLSKKFEEVDEVMTLFKLRAKHGLGIARAPQPKNDGIEAKLREIARDAPIAKDAEVIEEMAYLTAAIAEITALRAPEKDSGKKKRSDWINWSNEMRDAAMALAAAAKAKGGQEMKTAAAKVNNSCNNCHSVYR